MRCSEVRKAYLDFFRERDHAIVPSSPLIPENDPTTLFTGSGMQPMVPYLLGEPHPAGTRVADSQRCFRAGDIEEVGDNRHTTFFEMLGNWSFGDYFKQEQISWFFGFLTDILKIDPSRLYVTVFGGDEEYGIPRDEESAGIWKKLFMAKGIDAGMIDIGTMEKGGELGMQGGRIFYYNAVKNWWSRAGTPGDMPSGEPGGPDSEVFFDFGTPHEARFGKECHVNCDCGRFMEIGNSVFMEYRKTGENAFEKLAQTNVDFGGGLERITAAVNGDPDIFRTDAFEGVISGIQGRASRRYGEDAETTKAYRIIADHMRGAVCMLGEGIEPSNTDRGYMLRRLIRRSVQYGDRIGFREACLAEVAEPVIAYYEDTYPALGEHAGRISEAVRNEEEKFRQTLERGMREFRKLVSPGKRVSGQDAFVLFSTYGFPFEMTEELAREQSADVDRKGFDEEFRKHQELSRTASAGKFKGGLADHSEKVVCLHTVTHLLNAALRRVLGEHVWQKGSNITGERTRFDFTHGEKMTDAEKKEVERLVNGWIAGDMEVKRETMTREEAEASGAVGVFGEKYPDTVSVYSVVDPETGKAVSRELCGGPHVAHTGEIGGVFRIMKEESASAGVRRIKAVVE